jgi:nickel/cobalt transporter (NicO) family protein
MLSGSALALAMAAVSVGALHSLAPDHWVPFAAIARSQRWTRRRTAGVTLACGAGHVSVSALLGVLALLFGRALVESYGKRLESLGGVLLIGFGLAYAVWGLRKVAGARWHGHAHAHYDHIHDPKRATALALFLLATFDPCVAVVPILLAAAPLGTAATVAIVLAYEAATLATMVTLVLGALRGTAHVHAPLLARWSDAAAGALIAVTGLVVAGLGL